jgi:hypothetical protein
MFSKRLRAAGSRGHRCVGQREAAREIDLFKSSHLCCKENQQDRLAILRCRALRFFHYVCYDKSRNERTDICRRFGGGCAGNSRIL